MGIFIRRGSLLPGLSGLSGKMPGIPMTVSVNMFFDRKAVQDALSTMERKGLTKASLLIKDAARKSIKKVGEAKPKLKVMKQNPGLSMQQIAKLTGLRKSTKEALQLRIQEMYFPKGSPPGTPPYTHVPHSHMLGFRRNLYNGYDRMTRSAVVGPSKKGSEWTIPMLHEFGGQKTLSLYVWRPRYERYTKPIVRWFSPRETVGSNWVPTGQQKAFRYPARPYMRPALRKCLPKIAKLFEGQFSARVIRGPQ